MNRIFLSLFLSACLSLTSQNEFDKYGPYGSPIATDLKEALKTPRGIYKVDLSYQALDLKLYDRIEQLTDLQALKLSGNGVTAFPNNFGAMVNLVYFASYNNKLTAMPPLKQPGNLQYLDLQHTAIDSIPASIAYLGKLNSLKFGNTDDTLRLPATLVYLKHLRDLSLENCILDSLPRQVFRLSALNYLYLVNTNTWYLSKHFERLPNLEVLIVENNHLTNLPFDIYKAKKLRLISLRHNQLTRLPDSISQLEGLSVLDLRGNPIPPHEIAVIRALLPGCEVKF